MKRFILVLGVWSVLSWGKDHGCGSSISAEWLSTSFGLARTTAHRVASAPGFIWVYSVASLYAEKKIYDRLATEIVWALAEEDDDVFSSVTPRLLEILHEKARKVGLKNLHEDQFVTLAQNIVILLNVRQTRARLFGDPSLTSTLFSNHLRSETKRRITRLVGESDRLDRALDNKEYSRKLFKSRGIHVLEDDQEDIVGLPFLASEGDVRDWFETTSLRQYFTHRGYDLVTAGESLRLLLGLHDGERSADFIGFHPEEGNWMIAEVKQNPKSLERALTQLQTTWTRLTKAVPSARTRKVRFSVAVPNGAFVPTEFDYSKPDGLLSRNGVPILIDGNPVYLDRFTSRH